MLFLYFLDVKEWGWQEQAEELQAVPFPAHLELSLYLSEADVPGRMHAAARGEEGGVQDLNTFHYISHILFTHSCWPENNIGSKKREVGGCDRKEWLMGVVIPTPLLGVHIESARGLWFSLHRPLPATFSPWLWQALIDVLSSVIGECKGGRGAIRRGKK